MASLLEQVRQAQVDQGLSTQQLLDKSKLPIERSVLHRKLNGDTPATTAECEALATALGITLVFPKKARPAKKKRAAA